MPMLHPCSRCTQALPASAKFCRRCGAAVGESVSPPFPVEKTKPRSLITSGLATLVLAAILIGAFFYMTAPTPSIAPIVVPISPQSNGYVTDAPAQPDVQTRVVTPVRVYPPVMVPSQEHQRPSEGWREHDRGR